MIIPLTRIRRLLPSIAAAAVFLVMPCMADTIAIDENGNGIGTVGRGFLAKDLGPGGLPSVLTYKLPFAGIVGDLLFSAPERIFDLVRFNGDGTVLFYSASSPSDDALADVAGPPTSRYANFVIIPEVGPEGQNEATYTPTPSQPGYDFSLPHYTFVSDGTLAPEPGAETLALLGVSVLGLFRRLVGKSQRARRTA